MDYWALNKWMVHDTYPLPLIGNILNHLQCNGLAPFVRLGPLRTLKSTKYQHQTQRRQC